MTRALPAYCVRTGAWALLMPCPVLAADAMAAPVGIGSVLQVLLGLAVVLGMVFVAARMIRRINPNVASGSSALRIVAGIAVGSRERVLLLEVNGTWLVVGVAPGRVSQIHSMPQPENFQTAPAPGAPNGFAIWLKQTLERRKHG